MGWPLVKIKECCTVVGGATPKRDVPEYWGNDFPWITPKDISNLEQPVLEDAPEYISQAGYDSAATYMLPKGTILLTSRAPIGNVAIAGREMCTNQGFKSLVPGEGVDSKYLYYCMKRMAPKLESIGNGATFKEVSKTIVEGFEIPLPPLKEQKRIAAILDKADAIRRKRKQAIQLADEFLRSVFLELAGSPFTNPNDFPMFYLGHYFNFTTGKLDANRAVEGGEYPFFTCSRGDFWIDEYAFDTEALLLAGNNANADYSVKHYKGKFNAYQRTYVMTLKDENDSYPLFRMALEYKLQEMKRYSKGTNTKYLTLGILNDIELPHPTKSVQKQFEDAYFKINHLKKQLTSLEKNAGNCFRSLTQRAFRGEL